MTDIWTGLTTVTGVAVGPDGALYAAEMSTGTIEEPPFLVPGSGRIVRQIGPDAAEPVATGLVFPVTLAAGPDGALYASQPALGAETGSGTIVRIEIGASVTSLPTGTEAAPVTCAPVPETTVPPVGPLAGTPEASLTS